jgi:hypothetical protein
MGAEPGLLNRLEAIYEREHPSRALRSNSTRFSRTSCCTRGCGGRRRAVTPAAAGVVVAMLGTAAMAKTFHLTISGDADAHYAGACVVTSASGKERIALEGAVPAERGFVADGLSCSLRAEGRIVVEITHNGSRSRAETSGGLVQIGAR